MSRPSTCRWVTVALALLALVMTLAAAQPLVAQEEEAADPDPWAPFRLLPGTWEGTIDGKLGTGRGVRRYEFVLDDLYLMARHASVRLPQEKSPAGDYHREMAVYSFDSERGVIVLRDFKVEGFVLIYDCEVEPMRFVCSTTAVESGAGWRARLTIDIESKFRLVETFELAPPGRELEVYFTNTWTRAPDLAD